MSYNPIFLRCVRPVFVLLGQNILIRVEEKLFNQINHCQDFVDIFHLSAISASRFRRELI